MFLDPGPSIEPPLVWLLVYKHLSNPIIVDISSSRESTTNTTVAIEELLEALSKWLANIANTQGGGPCGPGYRGKLTMQVLNLATCSEVDHSAF